MLRLLTASAVGSALVLAVMAAYVRRRRGSAAGASLAVLLVSAAWWAAAYAMELSTTDLATRGRWGDLKYLGITVLPPAFLVFVAQYTGRSRLLTRRRLMVLAVEPALVCALLALPSTHDLIRYYKEAPAPGQIPAVGSGPLFWAVLGYANAVLLTATAMFLTSLWRLSRTYRVAAVTMIAAALLPWAANLLYNLEIGPFSRLDLTPFAFTVTGAVLVGGLYRERLIHLAPLGWGLAVATMPEAVLLCDAFGHVSDVNPAATTVLGRQRSDLIGQDLTRLLPMLSPTLPEQATTATGRVLDQRPLERQITIGGQQRHFEIRRHAVRGRDGTLVGELVTLRDITDRRNSEERMRQLLNERTRIAETLRSSLLPAHLPRIPGCSLAALYEPAGGPHEVAGDFYDVFPIDGTHWGIVLGDVSGKGAQAGAVTALIRYTLRTLALAHHKPSQVLRRLNEILLRDLPDEQYCTLIYAVAQETADGMELTICLGGHHPPLLRHRDGRVEPVGTLGTAPGLVDRPHLTDSTVIVRPGDLLCMFTDGLVEARDQDAFFGTDRAARLLAGGPHTDPQAAADHLATAAHQFHNGPLTDDLALLILSVPER
ncbi:histidine kinase N-terminal 7TM domain-containing protein [Pedococcus sp. P5_B7]